jgi:hypothetical protein
VGVTLTPPQPQSSSEFYYAVGLLLTPVSGPPRRVTTGTVRCRAEVCGRTLANFEHIILKSLGARCGWVVPGGTSGGTLRGSIVVVSEGATFRRTFAYTVR